MLTRLRPAHSDEALAALYPEPHRHDRYGADHLIRVAQTAALVDHVAAQHDVESIADLSCGDASITGSHRDGVELHLGDLAPGWKYTGPIEDTLDQVPAVDLFVCCETLEHLDDPHLVLARIRKKADRLVCSLPLAAGIDDNPEHYWQLDSETDGEELLEAAGWEPEVLVMVNGWDPSTWPYTYLIWACS